MPQNYKRKWYKKINRGAVLLAVLLVAAVLFVVCEYRIEKKLPDAAEKAYAANTGISEPVKFSYIDIDQVSLTRRVVRASTSSGTGYSGYFEFERSGLGWKLVYIETSQF